MLLKRRLDQLDNKLAAGEIEVGEYHRAKGQSRKGAMRVSMVLRTMA